MTATPETLTKVCALVVEHLGVDEAKATATANLIDDLGADSLDIVELAIAVEEIFCVDLNEDVIESLRTVGDLADAVQAKLGDGL